MTTVTSCWAKIKDLVESESPDLDQLKIAAGKIPERGVQLLEWSPIIAAVKLNRRSVIETLVQSGFSIDCIQTDDAGIYGWCAVGAAIDAKNYELAKHLVFDLKANPDLVNPGGDSLSTAAITRSDFETVDYLLGELKANPDIQVGLYKRHVYLLHLAIWHDMYNRPSDWKMTKLLLNHGANVTNSSLWTLVGDRVLLGRHEPCYVSDALEFARQLMATKQKVVDRQCLEYLLSLLRSHVMISDFSDYLKTGKQFTRSNLAYLSKKYVFLKSPVVMAAEHNRLDLIYELVKAMKFNVDSAEERTGLNPLAAAVKSGNQETVRYLVKDMGVDVNHKLTIDLEPDQKFECNVLAVLIYMPNPDPSMMTLLVQLGADPNYEVKIDGRPTSLLHLAIGQVRQHKSTAIVTQLLASGANVNSYGWVNLNNTFCQMTPIDLVFHLNASNPKDVTLSAVADKFRRVLAEKEAGKLEEMNPEELIFQAREAALLFEWRRARIRNQIQILDEKVKAAKVHEPQIKELMAREGYLTPEQMEAKEKTFKKKISQLSSIEEEKSNSAASGTPPMESLAPDSSSCDLCKTKFIVGCRLSGCVARCKYNPPPHHHIFCLPCANRRFSCPLCNPDDLINIGLRLNPGQNITLADLVTPKLSVQDTKGPNTGAHESKVKPDEDRLASLIRNHEAEMEMASDLNNLISSMKKTADPDFIQMFQAAREKLEAAIETPAHTQEAK